MRSAKDFAFRKWMKKLWDDNVVKGGQRSLLAVNVDDLSTWGSFRVDGLLIMYEV